MPAAAVIAHGWDSIRRWRLSSAAILLSSAGIATLLGMLAALSGLFSLVVGLVGVLSLLILMRPVAGVALLGILLPVSSLTVVPRQMLGITGLSPSNALLAVTLLAMVLHYAWDRLAGRPSRLPPLPRPLLWLYVLPVTAAALHGAGHVDLIPDYYRTVVGAISFDSAAGYLRDVLIRPMFLVVFALLVAMAFRDVRNPRWLLVPVAISGVLLAGLIFYVVVLFGADLNFLSSARARSYLSVLGLHANELSLLLNSLLACALFASRGTTGLLRWMHVGLVGLLGLAVVLTFSRGGFLGLLMVYVMFMLYSGNLRSLLLSVCAALLMALLLPAAVMERATLGWATGDRSAISAGRLDDIWLPLVPTFFESPLFGGGLSSVLWSAPARAGEIAVAHSHNAYLQLLLDFGIVGGACIMLFYGWAWRTVRQASRTARTEYWRHFFIGAAATIVLLFVQGLSDDRFSPSPTQVVMWFGIGAAVGYLRRAEREAVNPNPPPTSKVGPAKRALRPFGTGRPRPSAMS